MKYAEFTVDDLAADAFFQQWVLAPNEMSDTFWKDWQAKHPHKQPEVEQAIQLIREINFKPTVPAEQDFNQVWQEIILNRTTGRYKVKRPAAARYPWHIAASLLLLGLALGFWWLGPSVNPFTVAYRTEYGQTQEITLPDGSVVVLGANSQLHHRRGWAADEPRMVTVQGEAYFSVTHQANNQKFIVQSAEVAIEVLGTRFNVNNRRGGNQILLEEGSIRLDVSKVTTEEPPRAPSIVMKPGEVVEISSARIAKKAVDTAPYVSWTHNTLIFRHAPLREVIRNLEDHYGYTVTVRGVEVDELHFTAELRTTDPNMLLRYLAEVFDLTIEKENDEITITPDTTK